VILADTSVWVHHVRHGDEDLRRLLEAGDVLIHPFVVAEVAMGNLSRRETFLDDLRKLPKALVATDNEAMALMERERLYGLGIGYVDLHLLASVRLTPEAALWARDGRLNEVARRLGVVAGSG
jgi:predicted nucleic acid-binding protein